MLRFIPIHHATAARSAVWRSAVILLCTCGILMLAGQSAPAPAPAIQRLPKIGILPTAPSVIGTIDVGQKVFADDAATILAVAPEMAGINGVRIARRDSKVELDSRAPVQLLIGIFRGNGPEWAAPPGSKPVILNAATITGMPPLDVYLLDFDKGKRVLTLRGTYVILGIIPAGVTIPPHDAKGGVK